MNNDIESQRKRYVRKTFQGKQVPLEEMDDQHVQNVHWFNKIFGGQIDQFIELELVRRGIFYPTYVPHIDSETEIRTLMSERVGFLSVKPREDGGYDLFYQGNRIGEISKEIRGRVLGKDFDLT